LRRPQETIESSKKYVHTETAVPISHLQRRKIEGHLLIPFIEACRERFGEKEAHALVVET
jgi:hypothetical protein